MVAKAKVFFQLHQCFTPKETDLQIIPSDPTVSNFLDLLRTASDFCVSVVSTYGGRMSSLAYRL